MTCIVTCCDGQVITSLGTIFEHSTLAKILFCDSCHCTTNLILPDITVNTWTVTVMCLEENTVMVPEQNSPKILSLLRQLRVEWEHQDHHQGFDVLDSQTGELQVKFDT